MAPFLFWKFSPSDTCVRWGCGLANCSSTDRTGFGRFKKLVNVRNDAESKQNQLVPEHTLTIVAVRGLANLLCLVVLILESSSMGPAPTIAKIAKDEHTLCLYQTCVNCEPPRLRRVEFDQMPPHTLDCSMVELPEAMPCPECCIAEFTVWRPVFTPTHYSGGLPLGLAGPYSCLRLSSSGQG